MTVTAHASGTQTATIGTEHTLDDIAIAGSFQFIVDMINLAAGDIVELRCYRITLTGGTRRVVYMERFNGVQPTDDMIKESLPMSNDLTDAGSLRFTLKQINGTGKAFPWKVLQIG